MRVSLMSPSTIWTQDLLIVLGNEACRSASLVVGSTTCAFQGIERIIGARRLSNLPDAVVNNNVGLKDIPNYINQVRAGAGSRTLVTAFRLPNGARCAL